MEELDGTMHIYSRDRLAILDDIADVFKRCEIGLGAQQRKDGSSRTSSNTLRRINGALLGIGGIDYEEGR